ncbi:hypothetical protein BB31_00035 [Amycolatopsis lurida NRRL 2430]|uniref:Uncharacterized protein n=2 Tax=Amycolatopsis lurida TaxID=31959 RepID=A0A2P2G1S7_AMYLU|nr:hypothetical protein BB31_00035 [Amycolatopsis lurida NRRL 2430]
MTLMAAIAHRCACGHLDFFHSSVTGACTTEGCLCQTVNAGPPEVIPTWRSDGTPTGPTVEEPAVIAPGTRGAGMGGLCGCDACQTLYASVSGNAA